MRAVIIRHGKVDFKWKTQSTSEQFNEDCKMYDEVPLCASVSSDKKLPLIFWNVSGRLQWFFNIRLRKECRKETVHRARLFVEMIAEKKENSIVVTHGFFMHMLLTQMKKQLFQISQMRLNYSNGECVVAER